MYALIFLSLCYAALTVKLFTMRKKSSLDYPFWFDIGVPVWWVATYFLFAFFLLGVVK